MKKGHRSPYALSLQFGSCFIRLIELEHHRKGFRLHHCCEDPLPDSVRFEGRLDSNIKAACIRTLQSLLSHLRLKTDKATVGLDSRAVLLRRIPVDSWLRESELQEQVMWEAEQLLIDPLDHYVVDFHIQDINATTREVLLAIVRRKTVEDYVEIVEKAGLNLLCLDVDLFALSNAYEYATGGRIGDRTALIDADSDCIRCAVVHGPNFYFGRSNRTVSQHADLLELLDAAAGQCGETIHSPPFANVVLSGSVLPNLTEVISDLTPRFCQSVGIASPFREMKIGSSVSRQQLKRESAYMIAMGLALRGITET